MSKIKMLNTSLVELGTINDVFKSAKHEGLNSYKELQFDTFLTSTLSGWIAEGNVAEVDEDYFDIASFNKDQKEDGSLDVTAEFEHVSYRLNDPDYDMEYFTETGTPTEVLTAILDGTGFTVGTVEFTDPVTYSIQEKSSRRKMLMQFVSLLGGEVDFNQFEISILTQRGSATPKNITEGRNFTIIGVSFDKRSKDAAGNALVSYTCKLIYPMEIDLGDVVTMQYGTLGINISLRVVSISKNPYNSRDVEFEIGNFNSTLENDTYRIETSAVAKDKLYNGCRIGPVYGFENVLSNKRARSYSNATGAAWQVGDGTGENWTDKLYIYIDPGTGEASLMFDGELTANVINAIKAEIDIVISNTIIVNNLTVQKGNIADLTVDQLDSSDKVENYKADPQVTDDVDYIKIYNQVIEWIKAEKKESGTLSVYDRNGNQLYWTDETKTGITTDVTAFPVTTFDYDEFQKLKIYFDEDDLPTIEMGVGTGNTEHPEYGRGYIQKKTLGLMLKYITSTGVERIIYLNEDGIQGTSSELVDIDLYADGMFTEFADGTIYEYTFTKDIDGKITEIYNDTTAVTTTVGWNAGNKP
ncbi:MAG: hypothetical protein FIA99_05440 [Ruminiclostridium sp.]|nr:hypothetical protein [Ruminiclostridium sp.]